MTFDPTPYRRDTPAVVNGRIHLNNAGAALMPRAVLDAVTGHLDREMHLGGYEAADAARDDIAGSYADVAQLIGAKSHNIAVVENATVAFAQALSAFDFVRGDVILTSNNDYISNQLMYLSLSARLGVEIVRAADLSEGGVDPDSVRMLIRQTKPKLVAVTWVPTNSGLIQDVAAVGAICAESGTPFLLDACQAVGQLEIDVTKLQCDFLSATARKFLRGPRGVGFLYVSDRMLGQNRAPLYLDMRGAHWREADRYELMEGARRYENWEFAYALLLGQGAAARYALKVGVGEAGRYAAELAAYVRAGLERLPKARVLDRGSGLAAIVTVEIEGGITSEIVERLREQAININATHRDYAVIDMDAKHAVGALRISPHYYNTRREADIVIGALEEFAGSP
jgi:selenocysteine lyase/cysteine desulfurase